MEGRWSEKGEGERALQGNKRPGRTRHFEFPARGPPGRRGRQDPVSGQSEDKRVVRMVLNRSEYLYAGPLPSHLFCRSRRRRRRLPRVSTLVLRQRYLLDYPVLINSSGFIFIFTTPRRSRQPRGAARRLDRPIVPSSWDGIGKRDVGHGGRKRKRQTVEERAWSSTPSGTSWRSTGPLSTGIILLLIVRSAWWLAINRVKLLQLFARCVTLNHLIYRYTYFPCCVLLSSTLINLYWYTVHKDL